jgi:hypothetical protein
MDSIKIKFDQPISSSVSSLYEVTSKNLDFYVNHLDLINLRIRQIDNLLDNFPLFKQNEVFENLYTQLEFNGLLTISILDLSLISREIFISQRTWERLFYAKQTYLVIYETLATYHKHIQNINAIILKLPNVMAFRFDIINKEIKAFKKKYRYATKFYTIRNKIAGHIDKNYKIYYDTLSQIDIQTTGELMKDFVLILTSLQNYSNDLLSEYGKVIDLENRRIDEDIQLMISKITEILKNENPG